MSRLYRLDEDSMIASARDGGDGAIRRYLPKQRGEYLNYNQNRIEGGSLTSIVKKVGKTIKKGYEKAKKSKIISKGADVVAKGALWMGQPEIAGVAEAVSKGAKQFGLGGEHDLYISGSRFMNNFPMRPRAMTYSQGSDPLDFQGSMDATLDNIERNKQVQSITGTV